MPQPYKDARQDHVVRGNIYCMKRLEHWSRQASDTAAVPAIGARWDTQSGALADVRLKELTSRMPVIFAKAIPVEREDTKQTYECPVYKTRMRGVTYVWTFRLRSKEKAAKWVLAGVALLLDA